MKGYEEATRLTLTSRLPIVIRVDGKAFHSYTKGLARPVDDGLVTVMNLTAMALCKAIQGAQMAYVQSDEISILVHGYKTLESSQWFDNQVQKMASVSAGIASSVFTAESYRIWTKPGEKSLLDHIRPAVFDSRVFVVPENDVANYFLWRQKDATRNSVQTLARCLYSHKECTDKNNSQLQEMCFAKGRNWNDEPTSFRRGRCILKETYTHEETGTERRRWVVDNEIPVFSESRDYITKHLACSDTKLAVEARMPLASENMH